MKVLLVDDNDELRETIEDSLKLFLGAEVVTAVNGQEALDKLQELPDGELPDQVLTDFEMPDKTGVALLQLLRGSPRAKLKEMPVVVMSGILDSRALEEAVAKLGGKFLKKPFGKKQLLAALK